MDASHTSKGVHVPAAGAGFSSQRGSIVRKVIFSNGLNIFTAIVVGALWLACPRPGAAAALEREWSFAANHLRLANLIGMVKIESHTGSDIRVRVTLDGKDATPEQVQFEEHQGSRAEFAILFPVDEHRRFVYPALGQSSRTRFRTRDDDGSWLSEMLQGREIEVRGEPFRDAIEVWANVVVLLPAGKDLTILLGVGAIEATSIRGGLDLDTQSGAIVVAGLDGHLRADTGSGAVQVEDVSGDVDIDTGSGSVDVGNVRGAQRVAIDTGSGGVSARAIEARELRIDTGSGAVEVEDARTEELSVDTGSGGVRARTIEADGALIDTGSGSVTLELARMGSGRYEVSTGSGGIRLHLPRDVSAVFDVDTGSGSIEVDVEGVDLGRKPRHEARFTVGSGTSRVELSTGSGSVRIVQGRAG